MKFTNEELKKYFIDSVKKCECTNLDIRLLSDEGEENDNDSDIKIETIVFDGEDENLSFLFFVVFLKHQYFVLIKKLCL